MLKSGLNWGCHPWEGGGGGAGFMEWPNLCANLPWWSLETRLATIGETLVWRSQNQPICAWPSLASQTLSVPQRRSLSVCGARRETYWKQSALRNGRAGKGLAQARSGLRDYVWPRTENSVKLTSQLNAVPVGSSRPLFPVPDLSWNQTSITYHR